MRPARPKLSGLVVGLLITLAGSGVDAAQVLCIAHRGGVLYVPENTLAAFTNSLPIADREETDVRITSDGKFVTIHDATVDRTTGGTGSVADQTLAQLKLLDAGSWFSTKYIGERIPTLEEMITNTLPTAIPFVEAEAGAAADYVAEFHRLGVVANIILRSFDCSFLATVHSLEPNLQPCALGGGTITATSLISITNAGARIVAWEAGGISASTISLMHTMALTVSVWTVNSGAQITNFINLGVDGIISDYPWAVRGLSPPIRFITNPPPPSTYLAHRLVMHWRMDDGLTNNFAATVTDSAGTNHATLLRPDGLSHWVSGSSAKLGSSLQVNGGGA